MECLECKEPYSPKREAKYSEYCSPKCQMRAYRRTPEGKQAYTTYNKRYKRKDIKKVCPACKHEFTTTRRWQSCCSACSKDGRHAQRKYRDKRKKPQRITPKYHF